MLARPSAPVRRKLSSAEARLASYSDSDWLCYFLVSADICNEVPVAANPFHSELRGSTSAMLRWQKPDITVNALVRLVAYRQAVHVV